MVVEDFRSRRRHFRLAAMRDRTRELRQGPDSDSDSEGGGEGLRLRPPGDPALAQARRVGAGLRSLQLLAARLETLQERALATPLPPPELHRELQQLRDEIQERTREIRGELKGLEPPQDENPKSVGGRARKTQHGVLAQQFLGLTGRLQLAQARYRQRSLDRLRRQLLIAGSPPVSEEELEQMLESGQSEIFVSNVLLSARSARAALDELGERHRELQKLERGLRELGELFQLLGGTVEAQGELLDRVERHVQDSGSHLGKGRSHLGEARRRQQGARKKRFALAACVSLAVLVLVAIIAGSVAAG